MIGPIPFEVPAAFATQVTSGSVLRTGAILHDAHTMRIVGHLQETAGAQTAFETALSAVQHTPLAPVRMISSLSANLQLEQLRSMMQGLQMLQFANLALAAAGLGVAVASALIIDQKLARISSQMEAATKGLRAGLGRLQREWERARRSRLGALMEEADGAWHLTDPKPTWSRLAEALGEEEHYYGDLIAETLLSEAFTLDALEVVVQLHALCGALRIQCRVQSDELELALERARRLEKESNRLYDRITPIYIAERITPAEGNPVGSRVATQRARLAQAENLVRSIRELQDLSATRPLLIKRLIDDGIRGRDFVRQLREETRTPVVVWPCRGAAGRTSRVGSGQD